MDSALTVLRRTPTSAESEEGRGAAMLGCESHTPPITKQLTECPQN